MPEADTAWQGSRNVIAMLHAYASDCNAVKKKGFAQALYIAIMKGREGICYGLSVGYILQFTKTGSADEFLDTIFISSAKRISDGPDPEINLFYQKIASDYHHLQFGSQHIDFLKDKGFLTHVKKKNFDQTIGRTKKLAEFLADADGYYLIQTPNHAMASVKKGQTYIFFDPNSGEFTFATGKDFKKFIQKYFDDSKISRAYAGNRGDKINPGPKHKTLHFIVDHFA